MTFEGHLMYVLRTLGTLDLGTSEGDRVVSVLSQPKRLALLVYLAVARPRGFHRRDTILGLFWPELDHKHARAALRSSLHFLRGALTQETLLNRGAGEVSLDLALLRTDVADFEAAFAAGEAGNALDLYGGDFLKGFFLSDCPAFEQWVEVERQRLREAAAEAGWVAARERIEAGELTHAERLAQRALELVPTDESAVRSFILQLAEAGDRAAALRFHEKFASLLDAELEVEPSVETRAVVDRILAEEGGSTGAALEKPAVARQRRSAEPGAPAGAPPPPRRPAQPGVRRWLAGFAAVAVVAVAGAITMRRWGDDGGRPGGAGTVAEQDQPARIVVVPLQDQGRDEQVALWGDLAARGILLAIERAGLDVVPLPVVKAALASDPSGRTVAAATGATHVLTFTITTSNDDLRMDLRVGARDGSVSRTLDPITGTAEAIEAVMEIVATRAAAAAAAVTDREHPLGRVETLPPTIDALHRVHEAADLMLCEEDWQGVVDLLQPVLEEYPAYVPAHMWTVAASSNLSGPAFAAALDRLRPLVGRMTPFERAWVEMWTVPTAGGRIRAAEAAFAIDPTSQGYILAANSMGANRLDLALKGLESFRVIPHCPWIPYWIARTAIHHLRGEYSEELRWARDGLSSLDKLPPGRRLRNTAVLMRAEARALAALDSLDGARAVAERMTHLPTSMALYVAALAGDVRRHGREDFAEELRRVALAFLARTPEPPVVAAADALYHARDWERLLPLAEAMDQLPGEATAGQLRHLVAALEGTGRSAEADAAQARLTALHPDSHYRAGLPFMRGDVDAGLAVLMDVMARGGSLFGTNDLWLHLGPWDPAIYDDPRFAAFLRQVGKPAGE